MRFGDRYPNFISDNSNDCGLLGQMSEKTTEVQVVGPRMGDCSAIVREVADFLHNERYPNATPVCLSHSADMDQIRDADATILLLLNAAHTSTKDSVRLLRPLTAVVEHLRTEYGRDGSKTLLVFEGLHESTVIQLFSQTDVGSFPKASIYRAKKHELEKIKEEAVTHCANCRV